MELILSFNILLFFSIKLCWALSQISRGCYTNGTFGTFGTFGVNFLIFSSLIGSVLLELPEPWPELSEPGFLNFSENGTLELFGT